MPDKPKPNIAQRKPSAPVWKRLGFVSEKEFLDALKSYDFASVEEFDEYWRTYYGRNYDSPFWEQVHKSKEELEKICKEMKYPNIFVCALRILRWTTW